METKFIWIGITIVVLFLLFGGMNLITKTTDKVGAAFDVKMSIVEPDTDGLGTQSVIITSPVKTKVDVTTVPFKLTVINSGSIPLNNIMITTGTTPSQLVIAFTGKKIVTLSPGASGVLTGDVDVASLGPTTGSQVVNFQVYVLADYTVSGNVFTKSGFSEVLQTTIYPSQGLAVTVVYE